MKFAQTRVSKEDLTFIGILRMIYKSVKKEYGSLLLILLVVSSLASVFQIGVPKTIQKLIDHLTTAPFVPSTVTPYVIIVGILLLLSTAFYFISDKLNLYIATQTEDRWRYLGLYHYYSLPLKWHDYHDSGEIGAKIDNGAGAIYTIIHEVFGQRFVVSLLTLIFIVTYSFFVFPLFAIILLIPVPAYVILTYFISRKIAAMQAKANAMYHIASRTWYDGVGNLRYVKAFGKEFEEAKHYSKKWDTYHGYVYDTEKVWFMQSLFQGSIEAIMRVVLLTASAYGIYNHTLTIGQVVMLISFQQMTFTPLQTIHQLFTWLRRTTKRVSHLFEITMENDSLKDSPHAVVLPKLHKAVQVHNLTFHYGKKMEALHEISATFKAGTTTAIVGRSGAGKSTLAMVLLRFYDPETGSITWDGIDLRHARRASLREKTTLILQDTTLFNRSISDNIAYGRPHATQQEVEHAAKLAHAHEFIIRLPKGYNSIVGERGVRLSGGQRQRIAIARALLVKPELLVMDEATSHLDSETELAIQDAIEYLHGTHTQVIIAHRLSTVQHADNILLMDKGKIIAQGNHRQLLRHPLYSKLCRLQLQK